MEPDVVRMYASSPPPLDEDGEEEDEDDFGEFGGYCCGVSSSFSFSEYDTPAAFERSYGTDVTPPDLHNTSTQSVSPPEKEMAFEKTEKITNDKEMLESVLGETDVILDQGTGKLVLKVLHNGPLSSNSQVELSVVPFTGKERTSEGQDFKPVIKDEHRDDPNTDQVGHCLSNGPITICSDEEPEEPTGTSVRNIECVQASRAEDSSTETDPASNPDGIDSHELVEDSISKKDVSEVMDALAGGQGTESQEVVSSLGSEDQSKKKKNEKDDTAVSGLCGPFGASDYEIQLKSDSDDLRDFADSSFVPVMEDISTSGKRFEEKIEDREETSVRPVDKGSHLVPSRVELEVGFPEEHLPVADPTVEVVQEVMVELVISKVKRIEVGSSAESDEDFGDFRDATQGFPDISQTESVSQEAFADFVTALSDCSSTDEFEDINTLKDLREEEDEAAKDNGDDDDKYHIMPCSELPPSESFADFSSAPFGDLANTPGESWAEFGQHEAAEIQEGIQQESWAAFDEEQRSSAVTSPSSESRQNDMSFGWSQKLQHLFESTFPSEMAAEDSDVPPLQTLLEPQDKAEIRKSVGVWRHLLDIHRAHGLKVQWVGSHSNRILLDCLGIYNILFTGQNKKPVIVPMFAAGLGMLEPTKEPVKASSIFPASSPGQRRPTVCSQVVSSLGFEDDAPGGAATHLNLDFFGLVEDCSSDSDTDTPIPGVDPELYELTTAKLESGKTGSNGAEAFARLMEMVEKTSTLTRKPEQDGEISQEAAQVISLLPDLSFMHAQVLMFPSTLTPASNQL